MTTLAPFCVSHIVDAPRPLAFLAWTDVAHLQRWMGPPDAQILKADMDLRVGGSYHYGVQNADGSAMWGKQVYVEIVHNEKLVYLQSFSDPSGAITAHPLAPTWPQQMLSTTTFADLADGRTQVDIAWLPHESNAEGIATFDAARAGMQHGFANMFGMLDAHIAATELQILHSRTVAAPRERVWQALVEPAQVNAWWGPNGFQNTEVEQDVRVGGVWQFKMIAPDGTVYPNKSTYLAIEAPERLACAVGDGEREHFRLEITLQQAGSSTLVALSAAFPDRAQRDGVVGYAIEGGQQSLRKLADFLGKAQ